MAETKLLVPLRKQEERSTGVSNNTQTVLDYNSTRKAIQDYKPVQTPELDAAVGNTPDFVAPSQQTTELDRATFGETAGYIGRQFVGGALETTKNIANDWSYKSQASIPEQQVENSLALYQAGGTDKYIEAAREAYNQEFSEAEQAMQIFMGNSYHFEDYLSEYIRKAVEEERKDVEPVKAVDWGEGWDAQTQDKYENKDFGTLGQIAGDVSRGVGGMVPYYATSFIPGVGSAVASSMLFSSASGGSTEKALADGAELDDALNYGTLAGAVETLTEKLFGGVARKFGKGAVDDVVESAVRRLASGDTGRTALRLFINSAGEGAEEMFSEAVNPILQRLTYSDEYTPAEMSDILYSGLIGFLTGGVVETVTGTVTGKNKQLNAALRAMDEKQAAIDQMHEAEEQTNPLTDALLAQETNPTEETPSNRNFIEYSDTAARDSAQLDLHNRMVESGNVIDITDNAEAFSEFFPDLRAQKKADRTATLREKMTELKGILREYLNSIKGVNYEFDINGDIIEARLYNTGIKEVLEKITQNKSGMLGVSDQIFRSAEYLYSTGDKSGDPDVSGWDYFYVPVKIGDGLSGVRIAVRNLAQTETGKTDSQIYNWGIKNTAPLAGGSPGNTPLSTDGSSGAVLSEPLAGGSPGNTPLSTDGSSGSTGNIPQTPPVVNGENDGGNLYGSSVGASTPDVGPQVPTQSKPVTESNWMSEEEKELARPGTHERISEAMNTNRAEAMFDRDENGRITNAVEVLKELLNLPFGLWDGVVQTGAILALQTQDVRSDKTLFKEVSERYVSERSRQGQALQSQQKWIAHTPVGKIGEAQRIIRAIQEKGNKRSRKAAEKEAEAVKQAIENSVPEAADAAVNDAAQEDFLFDIVQQATSEDATGAESTEEIQSRKPKNKWAGGQNWKARAADAIVRKVDVKEPNNKTKTVAEQMISDLLRLTKDAAPKHTGGPAQQNPAANTEAFQNFLQNRAEYEQIVRWAQQQIAEKYADNPEMLQAFQDWLNNGISLRKTLSGVIREHGVEINNILRKSWQDKENIVNQIKDNILNNTDLTEEQKYEAAEIIHGYFWGEVIERSRAAVEKFVSSGKKKKTKSDSRRNGIKQQFEDMANLGAFDMEDMTDDVSDILVDRLLKEKSREITEIVRKAGYEKWNAVARIVSETLDGIDLTMEQRVALADKIHDRLWSEMQSKTVKEAEKVAGWTERSQANKKTTGQLLEELANLSEFVSDPDLLDALRQRAITAVLRENSKTINEILAKSSENKDAAIQEILDRVFVDVNLNQTQIEDWQSMLEVAIRDEIDARNRNAAERYVKPAEERNPVNAREKFMDMFNQGFFRDSDIREAVLDKAGLPHLTESEINLIYQYMEEAMQIREDDPELAARLEGVADKIIASKIPVSLSRKVQTFLMNSMLLGFKTLISKGFVGNAVVFAIEQTLTKETTALVDAITGKITNDRRYQFADKGYYKELGKGFIKGARTTVEDTVTGIHTPRSGEDSSPSDQIRAFQNKFMNAIDAAVRFGLDVVDRPFYEAVYQARMYELNKIRNKGSFSEDVLKDFDTWAKTEANLSALEAVFQKRGSSALIANALSDLRSASQGIAEGFVGIGFAGQLTMPFIYTPGNIMQIGMEYLPATGLVKNAVTTAREISKGEFNQSRFSKELGRNISGAFLTGLAYLLVKAGLVSGDDEDDLTKELGQQENSIKIGNTWFSYEYIPILSGILASTESFVSTMEEGGENPFMNAALDAGSSMVKMSALSGVGRMFGSGQGIVRGLSDAIMSGTGQVLPQTVRRSARFLDNYERSTYDQNAFAKLLNYFKAGIPGLREKLNPRYDLYGNPVEVSQGRDGFDKFLDIYVNPSYVSVEGTDDPRTQVLSDLREAGYNVSIPDIPTKMDFNGDGEDEKLTAEEHDAYWRTRNSIFGTLLTEYIGSSAFESMEMVEQQKLLNSAMDFASHLAKYELYSGRGAEYELTRIERLASQSSNPAQFMMVYKTYNLSTDIERGRNYNALDDLMPLYGSLQESEQDLIGDNSRIDDLYEASRVGIDSKSWYNAYDEYRRIDELEEGLSATDKATLFAKWLDTESGMNNSQIELIGNQMVYDPYTPADPTRYNSMTEMGISSDAAYTIYNAIGSIEVPEGETVRNWQRYEAIANSGADIEDIDRAMVVYMGGYPEDGETNNLITKYELMRDHGFTPKAFAFAYEAFTNSEGTKDRNGNTIRGSRERDFIERLGERGSDWASWGHTLYDLFYAGKDDLDNWEW